MTRATSQTPSRSLLPPSLPFSLAVALPYPPPLHPEKNRARERRTGQTRRSVKGQNLRPLPQVWCGLCKTTIFRALQSLVLVGTSAVSDFTTAPRPLVLTGRAASLPPYQPDAPRPPPVLTGRVPPPRPAQARFQILTHSSPRAGEPPSPPVQSGHVSSIPPY